MALRRLVNRNLVVERGRTSIGLEPELWTMLAEICDREGLDVSTLVRRIDAAGYSSGRTSAVRVYIAAYFRAAATEGGHAACGHGYIQRSRSPERSVA